MVVFTCNHCGDSLQKPKVAKHYQTTCSRNPINLTCVDCFKDFNLEEYVVHTKCFTEDDRYSAKGTAQKILKGEIKQTEWMNTVNQIIEQQKDAKPSVKAVLEALVNYDNIPRKEAKFMNFMKSTFKFKFHMNDFKEVWKLLEAHKIAMKKSDEQNGLNGEVKQKQDQETAENLQLDESNNQEKKSKKKKKKSESEDIVGNGTNGVDTSEDKSKKKKKSKQHDVETTNGPEVTPEKKLNETNEENGVDISSKKKKKRKSTQETTEIPQEKLNETNEENGIDTSKKKKRKSTQETIETPQKKLNETNEENGIDTSSKKKKRKSTQETDGTPQKNLNETNEENGIDTSSKKKKKRKSIQETDESPQKKQKTDETSETNGVNSSSKKKKTSECEETNDSKLDDSQNESFSFKQVIIDILTKKSKGLTKEALQNKVFKKYEAIKGPIENKEILLKKYNKKLKALKNIACDNDKYKLISE